MMGLRDMANITDFTEKQFEDRLEKNVERLTKNRLAVESPTAFTWWATRVRENQFAISNF